MILRGDSSPQQGRSRHGRIVVTAPLDLTRPSPTPLAALDAGRWALLVDAREPAMPRRRVDPTMSRTSQRTWIGRKLEAFPPVAAAGRSSPARWDVEGRRIDGFGHLRKAPCVARLWRLSRSTGPSRRSSSSRLARPPGRGSSKSPSRRFFFGNRRRHLKTVFRQRPRVSGDRLVFQPVRRQQTICRSLAPGPVRAPRRDSPQLAALLLAQLNQRRPSLSSDSSIRITGQK